MVTNYPQQLAASRLADVRREQHRDDSFVGRIVESIRQTLCGLRGHDSVLHFEKDRVLLRCTSCSYDSPGWDIGQRRPRPVFDGYAERHLLRPRRLELRRPA